jgi:hypothetical protein
MELSDAVLLMTIMPRKASPGTESGGRRAPLLWDQSDIARRKHIAMDTE